MSNPNKKRDVCLDFSGAVGNLEQSQFGNACGLIREALKGYFGERGFNFAAGKVNEDKQRFLQGNGFTLVNDDSNNKFLDIKIVPWEEYKSNSLNGASDPGPPRNANLNVLVIPAPPQHVHTDDNKKAVYKDIVNFHIKRNEKKAVKKSDIGTGLGFGAFGVAVIGIGIVAGLATAGIGFFVALGILALVGVVSPALGYKFGKSADDKENKKESEKYKQNVEELGGEPKKLETEAACSATLISERETTEKAPVPDVTPDVPDRFESSVKKRLMDLADSEIEEAKERNKLQFDRTKSSSGSHSKITERYMGPINRKVRLQETREKFRITPIQKNKGECNLLAEQDTSQGSQSDSTQQILPRLLLTDDLPETTSQKPVPEQGDGKEELSNTRNLSDVIGKELIEKFVESFDQPKSSIQKGESTEQVQATPSELTGLSYWSSTTKKPQTQQLTDESGEGHLVTYGSSSSST